MALVKASYQKWEGRRRTKQSCFWSSLAVCLWETLLTKFICLLHWPGDSFSLPSAKEDALDNSLKLHHHLGTGVGDLILQDKEPVPKATSLAKGAQPGRSTVMAELVLGVCLQPGLGLE